MIAFICLIRWDKALKPTTHVHLSYADLPLVLNFKVWDFTSPHKNYVCHKQANYRTWRRRHTLFFATSHRLAPKISLSFHELSRFGSSALPCSIRLQPRTLQTPCPPVRVSPSIKISPSTLHHHYEIICFIIQSRSSFYLQSVSCYAALSLSLSKLWIIFSPLLAVDLSIRRGESRGVIHDSLIDEDFNLIWFVNFQLPTKCILCCFP